MPHRKDTSLPDFMIIGAMKCGTSTLQAQLAAQSGVFMTTPKEPNFFSDDPIYAQGLDWYKALFADAAPGDLKGEASTHYTKLPTWPNTLNRMQAVLPNQRLVYMIRNPLVRSVSHYIHEWSEGRISQPLSTAIDQVTELTEYSRYGMQITPFAQAYGIENILLTSLERLKADPDAELARIGSFIGLADSPQWQHDLGAQNVSAERMRRFPLQGLLIDNPIAKALRQALVPKALRQRIRASRTMQSRPELTPAQRTKLTEIFLQDRETLAGLFPGDATLTDCYPFADT